MKEKKNYTMYNTTTEDVPHMTTEEIESVLLQFECASLNYSDNWEQDKELCKVYCALSDAFMVWDV